MCVHTPRISLSCGAFKVQSSIHQKDIAQRKIKALGPMGVAVMKPFKDAIRRFYLEYHMENPFPCSTTDNRALLSSIVAET
ncbi:hypothetical protein PHMEG_00013275 [Phytophthora megakarya]|uniref:Uncharacterized protein n=1 Tax=Phytophthora megakarya TaxID=4795 RepID=A0A225W7N1_9STRA|nr:hypothetical protein PHMEG_00013275 [Phytophthora megakarya]